MIVEYNKFDAIPSGVVAYAKRMLALAILPQLHRL
jgi:hypothetical protein